MEKIDIKYLTDELADQACLQLRQHIQNKGEKIVDEINLLLDEADDDDSVVFALGYAIKIDLTDMQLKGKLSFTHKESSQLVTAIKDPDQPEFDLGTSGQRGNMGGHNEGDSGIQKPAGRTIREEGGEYQCSRCGEVFSDEGEGEEHLSGPMCEDAA